MQVFFLFFTHTFSSRHRTQLLGTSGCLILLAIRAILDPRELVQLSQWKALSCFAFQLRLAAAMVSALAWLESLPLP